MLTEDQINEAGLLAIEAEYGTAKKDMLPFSAEIESASGYGRGFCKGAEYAQEQLSPKWVPISEYPKHEILKVSRWHKLWKCLVSVEHRRAYAENGYEWLSGTKDNTWPEEAFEPFFMFLPAPPVPDGK